MKRRSFLGLLGGVFAAPAVKANADEKPLKFAVSGITTGSTPTISISRPAVATTSA